MHKLKQREGIYSRYLYRYPTTCEYRNEAIYFIMLFAVLYIIHNYGIYLRSANTLLTAFCSSSKKARIIRDLTQA